MTDNIGEDSIWHQVWAELISATSASNHQFNTPTVANTTAAGIPRLRTVVLRHVSQDRAAFHFYTDRRSQKVRQLIDQQWFSYLFWDSKTQLQFTAGGLSRWLGDDDTDEVFEKLEKHSRKAYATLSPPSTELAAPGSGLPADWEQLTCPETDYARENFGVVVTTLISAEVLKLSRTGNKRLRAERLNGNWEFNWITP